MMGIFRQLLIFSSVLFIGLSCSGVPHIIVPTDPLTAEEHVKLGTIYDGEGLTEEARRQFQAALHQQTDHPGALIGLGNLSFQEHDYKAAEACYVRALGTAPGHPGASNNLAMIYLEQPNRLDEAERLARQALVKGGRLRPYILHTLAAVYIRQRRFEEARVALSEAELLATNGPLALTSQIRQARETLP
jgi:Flp pilus assembly protein TadD